MFTLSSVSVLYAFFFFNDTATTEIYTLSLHDALPILQAIVKEQRAPGLTVTTVPKPSAGPGEVLIRVRHAGVCGTDLRSEEHTSELQSPCNLVCRLLLEKKKSTLMKSAQSAQSSLRQT